VWFEILQDFIDYRDYMGLTSMVRLCKWSPLGLISYSLGGSVTGLLEVVEELIRGIKERTKEELENWGPKKVRLMCSTSLDEPNIMMDDSKEAEKWEHLDELRLWMKHVLGLMSDIVNNGLGQAFFVSTSHLSLF